ncbi:MAG: hypothetical protein ACTS5I_02085, partial [Rhodanobacter sp.]
MSVSRINVSELEAVTGMGLPAPELFDPVAAFHLSLGADGTSVPVQLIIPLQTNATVNEGDEIYFLRRGTIVDADGSPRDTWWFVENGYVATDADGNLVAKTASPPCVGVRISGDYIVATSSSGCKLSVQVPPDSAVYFSDWSVAFAASPFGNVVIPVVAGAVPLRVIRYDYGTPVSVDLTVDASGQQRIQVDLTNVLPPVPSPLGQNITLANFAANGLSFDRNANQFNVTLNQAVSVPPAFANAARLVPRLILESGQIIELPAMALPSATTLQFNLPANALPAGVALGSARVQLAIRLQPTGLTGSGQVYNGRTIYFAGNTARLAVKEGLSASLVRAPAGSPNKTQVNFFQQGEVVGAINLLDEGITAVDETLYGSKVQPISFTDDGSRAYIGFAGKVYAVDMITLRLLGDPIQLPGGSIPISSVKAAGGSLYIAQGSAYAPGSYSLLKLDIDPASPNYHRIAAGTVSGIQVPGLVTLQIPQAYSTAARYGFAGMDVSPDGRFLVVAAPVTPASTIPQPASSKPGNVLVIDLSLVRRNGQMPPTAVIKVVPSTGGVAPQYVQATSDPTKFLVTNKSDFDKGLATLTIATDAQGKLDAGNTKMTRLSMSQPYVDIIAERLDIQSAAGVAITPDLQYAFVSDNNFNFNDPSWRAMFETPGFEFFSPSAPPVAVGGSASAKAVIVGGKIGVIKDPFGPNPVFLGATSPIIDQSFTSMSLVGDSLLVQARGAYPLPGSPTAGLEQTLVFDVQALIAAANATAEAKLSLNRPIGWKAGGDVAADTQAQPISNTQGNQAGTSEMADIERLSVKGEVGDINAIDLKTLLAAKLGIQASDL